MRFLLLILPVFLALQVVGRAQEFNPKTEILGSSEKIVKGAPFSADAVSESVQLMFDGNKIVRTVKSSLFRDGEGRFRREEMPKPVGIGTFVETPKSVSIFDPVAGLKFELNSSSKTAWQKEINKNKNDSLMTETKRVEIEKRQEEKNKRQEENAKRQEENIKRQKEKEKRQEEKRKENENNNENSNSESNRNDDDKKKKKPEDKKPTDANVAIKPKIPTTPNAPVMPAFPKGEVKTESLGTRKIEGVEVEGTRSTKTIPAGEIGNERSFEITYERWFSKDLQLIIFSKYSDPRFGEQTYQLTNIKRAEPDSELFKVPADYKIIENSSKDKTKDLFGKKKSQ